jgi:hypothetical protein
MLGMRSFILIHVVSGLAGTVSGAVVLGGLLTRRRFARWLAIFLLTTLAACVTGFGFFPMDGFTSAQVVGAFTILLLTLSIYSYYLHQLKGIWKQIHVMCVVEALYLNVLIAIAQSFQHVGFLVRLAQKQQSAPYIVAKAVALLLFLAIGFYAVRCAAGEKADG